MCHALHRRLSRKAHEHELARGIIRSFARQCRYQPARRSGWVQGGIRACDDGARHHCLLHRGTKQCVECLLTQRAVVPAFAKHFPEAGGAFLNAFVQGQVRSGDIGAQNGTFAIQHQHGHGTVQRIRRSCRGRGAVLILKGRRCFGVPFRGGLGRTEFLAGDHQATDHRIALFAPRAYFPAIDQMAAIRSVERIVFAAHDVALQRTFIHLSPARMQARKNFILTLAHQRLHLLQAEFSDPLAVGEHVAHAAVKHGHGHRRIFHQHPKHHLHVFRLGLGEFLGR